VPIEAFEYGVEALVVLSRQEDVCIELLFIDLFLLNGVILLFVLDMGLWPQFDDVLGLPLTFGLLLPVVLFF
jgi:hypothetical protein